MAEEPTFSGWLPPTAPGAGPAPYFEPAPPAPEPPQAAGPAAAPPAAAPAAPGGADRPTFVRGGRRESNGPAVAALILGLVGLALLLLSLGLAFFLALPCSVAAWVLASQARARIAAGTVAAGHGQAQAGYVLGILGVVLGVLAAIGWIVAIASGLDLEELRRDLERQSDPDAVQAVLRSAAELLGR